MNKNFKLLKTLSFLSLLGVFLGVGSLAAKPVSLHTTHPQVAAVVDQLNLLYKDDGLFPNPLKGELLFSTTVNIHDFEPTAFEMKKLLKASPLIAGPTHHQQWLLKAEKAGLFPKKSLILKDNQKYDEHFWLHPKSGCEVEKVLLETFKEWKLASTQDLPNKWCQWLQRQKKRMEVALKKKGITRVILTHNSLKPLLNEINIEELSLRTQGHDSEIKSQTLKTALNWSQVAKERGNLLLILEKGFILPAPLINLENQKGVFLMRWSPLNNRPQPLSDLAKKLEDLEVP